MLGRFGFAATTLQSVFSDKLCLRFVNRCGGAVAVRATTGTVGKKAFKADRSLNSFLNSSPLKYKKKSGRKMSFPMFFLPCTNWDEPMYLLKYQIYRSQVSVEWQIVLIHTQLLTKGPLYLKYMVMITVILIQQLYNHTVGWKAVYRFFLPILWLKGYSNTISYEFLFGYWIWVSAFQPVTIQK